MFDVIYNNREDFTKIKNVIHLAPYKSGLSFYNSFDSGFDASYSYASGTPIITGTPTNQSFGVFSNYGDLYGSLKYDKNNFYNITSAGTIEFRLKTSFNNAFGYQNFVATVLPEDIDEPYAGIVPGDYSFKVLFGEEDLGNFTITLEVTDSFNIIKNKVIVAVNTPEIMATYVNSKIRIEGKEKGIFVQILPPTNANSSLIELLEGVEDSKLLNAPLAPINFFKLKNSSNNRNAIYLTHNIDGTIQLEMYNDSSARIVNISFDWDNAPYLFYAFAISFDVTDVKIYLNGTVIAFANTGFTRSFYENELTLFGTEERHFIDELCIYNTKLFNSSTYTVEVVPLTKYSILKPFIDIEYGKGYKNNEVKDVNILCSDNCHFVVKLGEVWYYYQSGGWVVSDGSYSQSVGPSIISTKFSELYFTEINDITIRVYFESSGTNDCWLDDLEIVFNPEEDARATIIGNVIVPNSSNFSTNKNIIIVTDLGMLEVDLTSTAISSAAVSKEEILSAINTAGVPGLQTATFNTDGKLVLTSVTTGTSAFISVQAGSNNSALSLVWGFEQSDYGESNTGNVFDYEEIFRYVRSQLGAPQVPVELTDEQLNDALTSSVYEYNRWRNSTENMLMLDLVGDGTSGYDIPAAVGGIPNIIDIIMQPKTGLVFGGTGDDLMANIYTQYFFNGRTNLMETAADYYLTISAQKDLDILLGTTIHHYFYNNKLWIFPVPTRSIKVGIKYRGILTAAEIVSNQQIKDLVLAKAKIVLGTIRATFGGRIPMGDTEVTLNGDGLKSEGKEEWAALIELFKKTQPIEFIIG